MTSKLRPNHLSIIWHPLCALHHISNHPESPRRVDGILTALRKTFNEEIFIEANNGTDEHIALFHTRKHVKFIRDVFMRAGGKWDEQSIAYSSEVRNKMPRVSIDGDTNAMCDTGAAAYRAVGAAIDAVDLVYDNSSPIRTVFCCVRPPGHHAERNRAGGFCFFNNAAIAARYAQDKYHAKRVAVLDFDVHHGNGTEEGFYEDETLFYGSTHEKDNYPGTGMDPSPFVGAKARKPQDRRIVNRTLDPRNGRSRYAGGSDEFSVRDQFRDKWMQIIKEMERFAPEFVVFSAGFDAHDADPLACCDLLEEDFTWATEVVLDACYRLNPEDPVKCISLLEGGYDIPALSNSALAHVLALMAGSPEARAAAAKATLTAGAEVSGLSDSINLSMTRKFGVFEPRVAEIVDTDVDVTADTPMRQAPYLHNISTESSLQALARQLDEECARTHVEALVHLQSNANFVTSSATQEVQVDASTEGTEKEKEIEIDDLEIATAVLDALGIEDKA